jgi:hypothetical protein
MKRKKYMLRHFVAEATHSIIKSNSNKYHEAIFATLSHTLLMFSLKHNLFQLFGYTSSSLKKNTLRWLECRHDDACQVTGFLLGLFSMPQAERLEPLQPILQQRRIHREGYAEPVLHPQTAPCVTSQPVV